MRSRFPFVLIVNSVLIAVICAQLDINERCQVARSGAPGVCRFYEDCPVVLDELTNQGLVPAKCGFQNRREIICCPLPPTPKPSIMPQTTNRISEKSKETTQINN